MDRMHEVLERARGKLPPEAIDFAGQSEDHIEGLAYKPSFDFDAFQKRVRIRNRSQQILVSHLYLDHILSALLEDHLNNPGALDLDRMSFAQKVQLAVGMGALKPGHSAALKSINSARNRLAHTLTFDVSDAEVSRIRSATPKEVNDWASRQGKGGSRPITLHHLLAGIVFFSEFCRQAAKKAKLLERKHEIEMAAVMIEARRVLNKTGS